MSWSILCLEVELGMQSVCSDVGMPKVRPSIEFERPSFHLSSNRPSNVVPEQRPWGQSSDNTIVAER